MLNKQEGQVGQNADIKIDMLWQACDLNYSKLYQNSVKTFRNNSYHYNCSSFLLFGNFLASHNYRRFLFICHYLIVTKDNPGVEEPCPG